MRFRHNPVIYAWYELDIRYLSFGDGHLAVSWRVLDSRKRCFFSRKMSKPKNTLLYTTFYGMLNIRYSNKL